MFIFIVCRDELAIIDGSLTTSSSSAISNFEHKPESARESNEEAVHPERLAFTGKNIYRPCLSRNVTAQHSARI